MKTRKVFEHEFTRHGVTPAQFLAYIRQQHKKHPDEIAYDCDLAMFAAEGWSFSYTNALPSEKPCASERGTDRPYDKQTYIRNFDGSVYNEIIEFQFDDEKTGTGYYYTVQVDVDEADREAIAATLAEYDVMTTQNAQEAPHSVPVEQMKEQTQSVTETATGAHRGAQDAEQTEGHTIKPIHLTA